MAQPRMHSDEDQDRPGLGLGHRPGSAPGQPATRSWPGRPCRVHGRRQRRITAAQARRVGAALDDLGVVWFEEPVSSDDIEGLAARSRRGPLRRRRRGVRVRPSTTPADWRPWWTACNSTPPAAAGTPAGWQPHPSPPRTTWRCQRTAHPALHAPVAAAITNIRHIEYFIDHTRLEPKLFDRIAHRGRRTAHAGHHPARARDVAGRHRRPLPPLSDHHPNTTNGKEKP